MKKYILIGLLFVIKLQADILEINEYQSDIYYGNGIMTTKKEAKKSLDETLIPAILQEVYNGDKEKMKKFHNFELSYNYSAKEDFRDTPIAMVLDLLEANDQLAGMSGGWFIVNQVASLLIGKANVVAKYGTKYISNFLQIRIPGLNSLVADYLAGKINKEGTAFLQKMTAPFTYDGQHDKNIKDMVKSYKESLKSGHGVILVTHSQGNLFAVEAVEKLVDWEKEYVHHVSIASPANKFASKSHWLTSYDNDIVANVPVAVGPKIHNISRYFTYDIDIEAPYNVRTSDFAESLRIKMAQLAPDGYWLDGFAPTSKVFVEQKDGIRYKVTATPDESQYMQFKFHAFDYYMGKITYPLHITEDSFCDLPLDNENIYHSEARNDIIKYIKEAIDKHDIAKSQWKIEKLQGCPGRCDARLALKHVSMNDYWFNFDPIELNDMVIPFMPRGKIEIESYFGKLYRAKDSSVRGKYIKSDTYGYKINKVNKKGICQVLVDEAGEELAEFEGEAYPTPPDTVRGPVRVKLSWDQCYPAVNLDLDVRWNTGYLDVHDDKNASFEHFVIEDEKYIIPRETPYAVYATDKTDHSLIDASQIVESENPIDITVFAVTPTGPPQLIRTQVTSLYQLNLGHILDIEVKEKLRVIYPTRDYGGGGSIANSAEDDSCQGSFNCKCIPCEYTITSFVKNAILGPISGGDVKISNVLNNAVVYIGSTTTGTDIVTTGIIEIPKETLETFLDEDIYLIEVQGGEDIDSNDDFYVDMNPVQNKGTIHAIVTGKQLKYLSFKVNILTEIAYQVSKDKIAGDKDRLKLHLDDIAKKIFRNKVFISDETFVLNYLDILTWLPTLDKNNLKKDYDTHLEPIVQKVYANKDRLQQAYDFVYKTVDSNAPELATAYMEVCSMAPTGTVLGNMEFITYGDEFINDVTLLGEGASNFSADKDAIIRVSEDANLSQKSFYTLDAVATNKNNHTSLPVELNIRLINTVGDANASVPYLQSMEIHEVDENAIVGTIVGKLLFVDAENDIIAIEIENNSTDFEISLDGTILVKEGADIDYEKTETITLRVKAINSVGNASCPVIIHFKINDVIDTPAYELFFVTHVDENVTVGTTLGHVKRVRDGSEEISSIDILNSDVPFSIDVNGSIVTTGYLDYEREKEYNLVAIARSSSGDSNKILINIYVDDIVEVGIPILEDFIGNVDENVADGTIVGTLIINQGESPVESIILYGMGASDFTVDNNGTILVAQVATLDYEHRKEYSLEVIAHNSYGESIVVTVNIMLNNTEDEPPTLHGFRGTVMENSSTGSIIGTLDINTTGISPISSIALSGDGAEAFSIDINGTVRLVYPVDYEYKRIYYLQARASNDVGTSKPASVTIDVLNVLDSVPILSRFHFIKNVPEDMPIDSIVGDISINNIGEIPTSYRLNDTSVFAIDNHGRILLKTPLDYEIKRKYILEVIASNSIGESRPAKVIIDIVNVVEKNTVIFEIEENALLNTSLGVIDVNSIENIVSITLNGIESETFSIDENGTVQLVLPIDYETQKNYFFNVIVIDSNGISLEIPLQINILNVLDHVPVIYDYSYDYDHEYKPFGSIKENASIGEIIGKVSIISSGDSATEFRLDDTSVFQIDNNGVITLNEDLDYEKQRRYTLSVIASNDMGESNPERITINIINLLEGAPILKGTTLYIEENTMVGTVVGKIEVESIGTSEIKSMSLSGKGTTKFSIDSNGTVRLESEVDYENVKVYHLKVEAVNSHGISLAVDLEINVTDVPDHIPVISPFYGSVEENARIGRVIGRVALSGGRDNATSYTLDDTSIFYIYNNGTIILNEALDYEKQRRYTLSVIASNDMGESKPVAVTIDVLNILEGAPILKHAIFNLEENTTVGTVVGKIEVESIGSSQIESMSLHGDGAEKFTIDNNGTVRLDSELDYENVKAYHLKVEAVNSEGISLAVDLEINVTDVPDHIPVIFPFYGSVVENSRIGSVIGRIQSLNNGDTPTEYKLNDTSVFQIDNNGVITLNATLDYEKQKRYSLSVTASNGIGESTFVSVIIDVLNILEGAPILNATTLYIEENATMETILGSITIESIGTSGIESMSLTGNGAEKFSVDENGVVKLVGFIDYEIETHYNLSVVAINAKGSSFPRTMKINVVDIVNDNPVLNDTTLSIVENASTGTIIGRIDINSTGMTAIEYMTLSGEDSEKFSIDFNGVVRLNILLGSEHKNIYSLTVTATNSYGNSPVRKLTINVLNVPSVNSFIGEVVENSFESTIVGTVNIESSTPLNNVYLTGTGSENFTIDLNGTIRVAQNATLDYEKYTTYVTIAVNATNQYGTNKKLIRIDILDILDSPPTIGTLAYGTSIAENSQPGTEVGKVTISHETPILNVLLSGRDSEKFTIDFNGTIRVADRAVLDYDVWSTRYPRFVIEASNKFGTSSRSVSIRLSNVPDPTLYQTSLSVAENSVAGTIVGTARIDSDTPLTEAYLTGVGSENFTIDLNGTIRVAEGAVLDYESNDRYAYGIIMHVGNKYGTNSARVYMGITNVPDTPPSVTASCSDSFFVEDGQDSSKAVGPKRYCGYLYIYSDSTVDSVSLVGENASDFTMDTKGVLSVAPGVIIDINRTNKYTLSVVASNYFGESTPVVISIDVHDKAYMSFNPIDNILTRDIDMLDLTKDTEGNIYVAGTRENHTMAVIKYNPDQTIEWIKDYNVTSSSSNWWNGVENLKLYIDNNKLYVVGDIYAAEINDGTSAENQNIGEKDIFAISLDTNGTNNWVKQFGTVGSNDFVGMLIKDNRLNIAVNTPDKYDVDNNTSTLSEGVIYILESNGSIQNVVQFDETQIDKIYTWNLSKNHQKFIVYSNIDSLDNIIQLDSQYSVKSSQIVNGELGGSHTFVFDDVVYTLSSTYSTIKIIKYSSSEEEWRKEEEIRGYLSNVQLYYDGASIKILFYKNDLVYFYEYDTQGNQVNYKIYGIGSTVIKPFLIDGKVYLLEYDRRIHQSR